MYDFDFLLFDELMIGVDLYWEYEFFDFFYELNESVIVVMVSYDLFFVISYVCMVFWINCMVECFLVEDFMV